MRHAIPFGKIFAVIKRRYTSFIRFYRTPSNPIFGVMTWMKCKLGAEKDPCYIISDRHAAVLSFDFVENHIGNSLVVTTEMVRSLERDHPYLTT